MQEVRSADDLPLSEEVTGGLPLCLRQRSEKSPHQLQAAELS